MKKIVMTAAVVACAASIVSAQVYSENIVGYAKKDLGAGAFRIVCPQFQGTGTGTTLDDAFSGVTSGSAVYAYNGTAYDIYTYYGATYGWLDSLYAPAGSVVIPEGSAVWLKDGGTTSTTIMAGEVPSASSITLTLSAGFNLIANPYPVALALDDLPVASLSSGDAVYVFNGTAYDIYTYYGATYGWLDSLYAPAGSVEIPVGDGFWLNSASGGSMVINKAF